MQVYDQDKLFISLTSVYKYISSLQLSLTLLIEKKTIVIFLTQKAQLVMMFN